MTSIIKVNNIQNTSGSFSATTTDLTNAPAFQARISGNVTNGASDGQIRKVEFNSEEFDTNNAYDNSTNYRFTPQVAGKYYVFAKITVDTGGSNMQSMSGHLFKNDSEFTNTLINFDAGNGEGGSLIMHTIIDLNGSSDYVDARIGVNTVNDADCNILGDNNQTYFGAYKLIGI